ncbi:MAG: putative quinol monooxygenase [Erythrobacter sp.]
MRREDQIILIVLAKANVGEGAVDGARSAIDTMVAASRAEAGCIDYSFTTDILDPGTMHIVEKWQDEAALVAHFQTPHMAEFQAAIAALDVTVTEAMKYESSDGQPLM